MELIVVVGRGGLFNEGVKACERPAVELHHVLGLYEVVCVEAGEVAEAVAGGVAELEVIL